MRMFMKLILLATTLATFGCAHDYYKVSRQTLEKVKVVGVAPFFVDRESDIKHPEKGAVLKVIEEVNRKNEKELIARLKETGTFYAVRPVDEEPGRLFNTLLERRERRDDAGVVYNKYFFKNKELKELMDASGLDAIMLVTVSGLTRKGKVYASNLLSYLETDFNYLSVSAQLLNKEGLLLWEYPNFKRSALDYPMLFSLQYPDFDEARENLSDQVDVKFKTVAGVIAAFAQNEPSSVANGTKVSTLYRKQIDEMISLMKTDKPFFGSKKEEAKGLSAAPTTPAATPAAAPAAPAAAPPQAPTAPAAATSGK